MNKTSDQIRLPDLKANEVHVWTATFNANLEEWAQKRLLPVERQETSGWGSKRQIEFSVGRAILRRLVAHYENRAPETLKISVDEFGKPSIPQSDIHFSISHTSDMIGIALSKHAVGFDIQIHTQPKNLDSLAARIMTPVELSMFNSLNEKRSDYFFQTWAKKEAYSKLLGRGLQEDFAKIEIESTKFRELNLGTKYSCAVCWASPEIKSVTHREFIEDFWNERK